MTPTSLFLAQELLDANQPDRALTVITGMLATAPDDAIALRLAAVALSRLGRS